MVSDYYRSLLIQTMDMIASRYKQDGDYPWINTKIDIVTGKDFEDNDFFKGRNTVYAWIQGRGLEAIGTHLDWLKNEPDCQELIADLERLANTVYSQLEKTRKSNNGHLFFFLDKDGNAFKPDLNHRPQPLDPGKTITYNYSDLFCAKGMYRAANHFGSSEKEAESAKYLQDVISSIWSGDFESDQYSFRGPISGAAEILDSLGPYMLAISGINLLIDRYPDYAASQGIRMIEYVIDTHINTTGSWGFGEPYDCVENVDANKCPRLTNGIAESDPGHSLEFVGLGLKFFQALKETDIFNSYSKQVKACEKVLINILFQNFNNGYSDQPGGICKMFDLVKRVQINRDMPWWSLPETMRAALLATSLAENVDDRQKCFEIYVDCHNSFVSNYISPEIDFMAIQTLGSNGEPKNVIPATPDADPGYHTGLSLIDCVGQLKKSYELL